MFDRPDRRESRPGTRSRGRPLRAALIPVVCLATVFGCSPDDPDTSEEVTFPPTSFASPEPVVADSGGAVDPSVDPALVPPTASPPTEPAPSTTLPPALTREESRLVDARVRWAEIDADDYEISFVVADGTGSATVERIATVIGGAVADVVDRDGNALDEPGIPITVDGLFDLVESRLDDDSTLQVVYDLQNGSPVFVELGASGEQPAARYTQTAIRPLELTVDERQSEVGGSEADRIASAAELWATTRDSLFADGYVVTFEATCNTCPRVGTQRVTVVDGEAVDGVDPSLEGSPFGATIDGWFDFLRFVVGNVDGYSVDFDPGTGVPFSVDVDARREVDGDEFRLDVLGVERLDSPDGP